MTVLHFDFLLSSEVPQTGLSITTEQAQCLPCVDEVSYGPLVHKVQQ